MKTIDNRSFVSLCRDLEDLLVLGETKVDLGTFEEDRYEAVLEVDSLGSRTVWLTLDGVKKTMCDADGVYLIDIAMVFWTYINA